LEWTSSQSNRKTNRGGNGHGSGPLNKLNRRLSFFTRRNFEGMALIDDAVIVLWDTLERELATNEEGFKVRVEAFDNQLKLGRGGVGAAFP
jgi:hypothetical protein